MTNRPLRVFLCHASADKPAVRDLYEKLTARGIDVWLDEKKLLPGQLWKTEIPKAVREADAVIICLSKTSITKEGYVQKEIKFALDVALEKPEGTIYLIPARLEECKVPDSLSEWQWVNLFEPQGWDFLFKSLQTRANSLGIEIKPEYQPLKEDPLFSQAVEIARSKGDIAPAILQKRLGISYTRASRIIHMMEDRSLVTSHHIGASQFYRVLDLQDEPMEPKFEFTDSVLSNPSQVESLANQNKLVLSNGMEFMRVPAGEFIMGSNRGEDNEKPQHNVDLPYDYWMARYPVTNEQYNVYVKAKGIRHPVSDWQKKKDHPVVRVSWNDVADYYKCLNNILKTELPSGMVARLPAEAEWEKAARGMDGPVYPWGNTFDKNKCNSSKGGMDSTTPVGSYSPQGDTPYGCANMAGNVGEWTHSIHKPYPYNANDGRENEQNSMMRVLRGGAYNEVAWRVRCAFRDWHNPNYRYDHVGFRIVVGVVSPA